MLKLPRLRFLAGLCLWLLLIGLATSGLLAQTPPPKPTEYATDRAGVIPPDELAALNHKLADFERETSNQLLVAIFPKLPEGAEIAQYCTETFHAWGVGQKDKDNGVILFVFVDDHKVFISTGRGLEGALPDAICKTIITQEIVPRFKEKDFAGGVDAAVTAMMAATRGEYKGNEETVYDRPRIAPEDTSTSDWVIRIFIILVIIFVIWRVNRGKSMPRGGGRSAGGGPVIWGPSDDSSRGSSGGSSRTDSGSSSSGGSSDGYRGGGGDSAGGGAGGSW